MEEVLDVYARPVDPDRPLVCLDEASKELHGQTVLPTPAAPGQLAREDYTYTHGGLSAFFLLCAPHLGWREMRLTGRRTAADFAHVIRYLVDEAFPAATQIVLVLDNLNTHAARALYQTFPAPEARRLWRKLEVHYTPKHASWLNVAECELSALARQCLHRRIPTEAALEAELRAWTTARNATATRVRWHFTTDDARIKLQHLYPILEPST
jgi:hypothetical protein